MEIQKLKISEQERKLVSVFMGEEYPEEIDFNWLMPVCQKIREWYFNNYTIAPAKEMVICYANIQSWLLQMDIEKLWEKTVEFIKWYKANS
jgi:hypothetical protein